MCPKHPASCILKIFSILQITINYADDIYPFELKLDIQKHVSENGELDDRINSLEYQVRVLKEKLYEKVK